MTTTIDSLTNRLANNHEAPLRCQRARELKKRIRLLEVENEVLRRAAAYLLQAKLPGKRCTRSSASWPPPTHLSGVRVAVTCRVLGLARQPYYRRLEEPVTNAEFEQAYRAITLFDVHKDDPEFGYRFLVDEARDAGVSMADGTAWRICSEKGWWSGFGKKRRDKNGKKPGPPIHDDLCAAVDDKGRVWQEFTAEVPNRLWLADITECGTGEGKLYLCAIRDVYANRIVGYSIDSRMKSRIAVNALNNAVARRQAEGGDVAGATQPWRASSAFCRRTCSTADPGQPVMSSGSRS
jgi:transposase InsO family protein